MVLNITEFNAPLLEAWYESPDVRVLKVGARGEFKPGQFYMVGFDGYGTKAMSVCSSPTREYLEFGAKLTSSAHKKRWAEIKPGEPVQCKGPYGLFVLDEAAPNVCMIAGGIGITPFKCYVEYALDKGLATHFTLLYSNRTPEDRAFSKGFLELAQKYPEKLKVVETITRLPEGEAWGGRTGRINREMIEQEVPGYKENLFYICGVPEMVRDMGAVLTDIGVDKRQVKKEEFTGLH